MSTILYYVKCVCNREEQVTHQKYAAYKLKVYIWPISRNPVSEVMTINLKYLCIAYRKRPDQSHLWICEWLQEGNNTFPSGVWLNQDLSLPFYKWTWNSKSGKIILWKTSLPSSGFADFLNSHYFWVFFGDSDGKESGNAGEQGSIPGPERSPGEGSFYPLQYSCLENSMNRGAPGLQSMGCKESDTTEWLPLSFTHQSKLIWDVLVI